LSSEFAFEEARRDAIAGQARGLVADDRVEAPTVAFPCLGGERDPAWALVASAGLLVEELGSDLASELGDLPLARLEL
jgi:hypothetical protein